MKKVLIADDDPNVLFMISEVLARNNYESLTASDGVSALELAKERRPDLAVLDVMMPGLDGFEVCRKIKDSPDLASTTVILLTAKIESADIQTGLASGADYYFTKPFSIAELLAKINELSGCADGKNT